MRHLLKGQRGFTLIELLAVMAIMAVLVAVVAPSVTGSKDASIDAQVMQDANQVRTAATNYFKGREEAETRTPYTTAVGAIAVTNETVGNAASASQFISNRWPEDFITHDTAASSLYETEFEPVVAPVTVVSVTLLGKTGNPLAGSDFLKNFTAVKIGTLVSTKLLAKNPAGYDLKSDALTSLQVSNFLWLFEKTGSGADRPDDSREVAVFKLVKVTENEPAVGGAATTVSLVYRRVF